MPPTPEEIEAYAEERAQLALMEAAVARKRERVEELRKKLFESQATGPPASTGDPKEWPTGSPISKPEGMSDEKYRETLRVALFLKEKLEGRKPTRATSEILSMMIESGGAVTVMDVAKKFDLTTNAAQARLLRGVTAGWFIRVGESTYSLGYPKSETDDYDSSKDVSRYSFNEEGNLVWK